MAYAFHARPLAEKVELPSRPDAILAYRYYSGRKGEFVKRLALLTREGKIYLGRDVNRDATTLDQTFQELLSERARELGLEPVVVKHRLVCPGCGLRRRECRCRS
jgi:hypothetical protein